MTMTDDTDIAALSFEQALSELERIVAELESGDADLERAVDVYRRGAQLRAHCESKLKAAQLKVESIILGPPNSGQSGAMGVEPAAFA
jgi:exodeoxyribonuclease VII small subunit